MKKFIEHYIFPLLILGFVVFSLVPTFYELSRAGDLQPDRQFELVHNFYTDYNFYLSRIREGIEGRWTVVETYTSEPHAGGFIHEMYLLMGRVGRMVRVPWGRSGDVYHTARVVLAATLLSLIAWYCKKSFEMKSSQLFWALFAFLLAVTASTWPTIAYVDGVARFGGYMPWWSVMDSLQRITFIPHLLAGQALMIFLVGALTDIRVFRSLYTVFFLGALAFVLGMIFPPGLIFVIGVVGVFGVIEVLWEKKIRWMQWSSWTAIVVISAPALVYLALMTSIYPWHRLTELDILHPLPFDYVEYIKALGPMLPLGLIGLVVAYIRKEKVMLPAVAWVVAWIVFLVVFHFVPQQSPLRFSEMIPHVPLGILTAYVFYRIVYGHGPKYVKSLVVVVPMLLVCLGLGQMYSSWLWQKDFVDHKIRATYPLVPTGSYVMYPLKDFYTAILYIEEKTKGNGIILSETTAGNYIPVYSGNTVYIGHDNTVNAEAKKEQVRAFYTGSMSTADAKVWLTKEHIVMIYFGPQELEEAGGTSLTKYYPFLNEVYANPSVSVYTTP